MRSALPALPALAYPKEFMAALVSMPFWLSFLPSTPRRAARANPASAALAFAEALAIQETLAKPDSSTGLESDKLC